MSNATDPNISHVEAKSGGGQSDAIEFSQEEIQADLKSIEEMREAAPKRKCLRHTPSMFAAKKRKHKIALQKAARKRQRGN